MSVSKACCELWETSSHAAWFPKCWETWSHSGNHCMMMSASIYTPRYVLDWRNRQHIRGADSCRRSWYLMLATARRTPQNIGLWWICLQYAGPHPRQHLVSTGGHAVGTFVDVTWSGCPQRTRERPISGVLSAAEVGDVQQGKHRTRTDPWETPCVTGRGSDVVELVRTNYVRSIR